MISSRTACKAFSLLCALNLLGTAASPAMAVEVNAVPSTIQQFGTGSGAYIGHTVLASSDYSTLTAGGSYVVQCNDPATLQVTGSRSLSSTRVAVGKHMLIVTIPLNQPAIVNISGWAEVPPGTLLCNYRWTAEAREGGLSISAGGVGTSVGNGSASLGGTVDFEMIRPNTNGASGRCTP